jgi:hypothetical protein
MKDRWKNSRDKLNWRAWRTGPEEAEISTLEAKLVDLDDKRGRIGKARERIQRRATMRAKRDQEQKK